MRNDITNEERYLLWLSVTLSASLSRTRKLMNAFEGSAEEIFASAREKKLEAAGIIDSEAAGNLEKRASERYIDKLIARLDELGVNFSTVKSKDYPVLLKEIYDPPTVLYYKGKLYPALALPIAVIGSREPTEYGKRAAEELARGLADAGACIISGLAYGIDCIAAESALRSGADYPTVAVMGGGPDVVYPGANRDTYSRIVERGAVISEYMPGSEPRREHFPMRNRIISGMSKGVVIVEAAEHSGTNITAECALEQGRDLFAVPGRIYDLKSAGTNQLIKSGSAKMTVSIDDILEEYGRSFALPRATHAAKDEKGGAAIAKSDLPEELTYEAELIYTLLSKGEKNFDELCVLTGLSPSALNSSLTEMEFSGIIKQSAGRLYSL